MDALPEIEQWRVTLTRNERLKLNHPTTVWRNYQKATEISEAKPAKPSKDDALRELDEERHAAAAEIERLKARIAELEEEIENLRERLGEEAR
jgi:predicted  nucleic acid-binding Zn-ribbon protein